VVCADRLRRFTLSYCCVGIFEELRLGPSLVDRQTDGHQCPVDESISGPRLTAHRGEETAEVGGRWMEGV
jgi:hypothetical protein